MARKRKANDRQLQHSSRKKLELERNRKGIDDDQKLESNMSISELKNEDGDNQTAKLGITASVNSLNVICEEISTYTAIAPIPKQKSLPIFVLDQASLTPGLVRKKRKILYEAEDRDFLLKKGKKAEDYRPDIFYEALRGILDSPLNKYEMVGAVFVKTDSGVLFEVKPHALIPRTFKRFCGLMLELLDKSCIRAKDTGEVLFKVLEGPLKQHIPGNVRMIGLSYSSTKNVDIDSYLSAVDNDLNPVFVVGAMAQGKVNKDGMDDYISVSDYRLSAKWCIGLICEAWEQKWKIF